MKINIFLVIILASLSNILFSTVNITPKAVGELKENGVIFSASNTIDNNISTAWAYRMTEENREIFIIYDFNENIEISNIFLANGFCRSQELYENNARIKRASMDFYDKNNLVSKKEVILDDIYDLSQVSLEKSVQCNKIQIKIHEIYPGKKYQDLCLSEIFFNDQKKANSIYYVQRILNEIPTGKKISIVENMIDRAKDFYNINFNEVVAVYTNNLLLFTEFCIEVIKYSDLKQSEIVNYFREIFVSMINQKEIPYLIKAVDNRVEVYGCNYLSLDNTVIRMFNSILDSDIKFNQSTKRLAQKILNKYINEETEVNTRNRFIKIKETYIKKGLIEE